MKVVDICISLKRNARTFSGVLLVFFCNGIDVIKKLHLCHSNRTPEEHKEML
jgi:hypothetical protein